MWPVEGDTRVGAKIILTDFADAETAVPFNSSIRRRNFLNAVNVIEGTWSVGRRRHVSNYSTVQNPFHSWGWVTSYPELRLINRCWSCWRTCSGGWSCPRSWPPRCCLTQPLPACMQTHLNRSIARNGRLTAQVQRMKEKLGKVVSGGKVRWQNYLSYLNHKVSELLKVTVAVPRITRYVKFLHH